MEERLGGGSCPLDYRNLMKPSYKFEKEEEKRGEVGGRKMRGEPH
jgi:hypothetical protein